MAEVPCPGSPLPPPRCATLTEPQLHPLSALGCGDKTALLQNTTLHCAKDQGTPRSCNSELYESSNRDFFFSFSLSASFLGT